MIKRPIRENEVGRECCNCRERLTVGAMVYPEAYGGIRCYRCKPKFTVSQTRVPSYSEEYKGKNMKCLWVTNDRP